MRTSEPSSYCHANMYILHCSFLSHYDKWLMLMSLISPRISQLSSQHVASCKQYLKMKNCRCFLDVIQKKEHGIEAEIKSDHMERSP